MSNIYNNKQQYPYYVTSPQPNPGEKYNYETSYYGTESGREPKYNLKSTNIELKDYGPSPFVVNIEKVTKQNDNFRTALWTGNHLQLTLMSIPVRGEIGLESHPDLDQFIRIEEGQGIVKMGNRKDSLDFQEKVYDDYAFIIPAGTWHNLINTGNIPIKLYSIYAPPQHPHGTVHTTKEEAEAAEQVHSYSYQNEQNTLVNNQFGAEAAKADKQLTLEKMMIYAIQDEFLARARYLLAIEKFGQQLPFTNIFNAEKNHINYLIPLFTKYNVAIPTDDSVHYVKVPANIKESLEAGVRGEIENIAMYERFLNQNIPNDVKTVFTLLRNASHKHMQAFQRALSFY